MLIGISDDNLLHLHMYILSLMMKELRQLVIIW